MHAMRKMILCLLLAGVAADAAGAVDCCSWDNCGECGDTTAYCNSGASACDHYAAAAAANYDAAPFAGPNSLSPARDAAADRQAKKEHILKSRPTSKDRARWSDEEPFVPPAAGPPPDAGADFFA